MIQINPLKSYIDGGVRAAITTPPSASLVFDLPGKAIWVKGVKLKGTDHTYTFSHDNYITLTNTSNSNESEDIKIGVNTSALKNAIDTTYGVVSTTTNGLAPKFTSENKLAASTATTYYFLGWTGSTLKWYQAPFRNVRINSETTDRLGVNNTDPLIISSGNGISVTWDSTNKKIIITNTKPDVNHNTDKTGIKLATVSGTKKTDSTLILANSATGLNIQGGTNKFLIGDGTNYIEVPITPSFTVSNKDATIGTTLTTIATIAGVDIKAKIASYSLSNHTHSVTINGSTKTITTSGTVDLGNYLPLSGGTMSGSIYISNSAPIIHTTNSTSNWVYISELFTGSSESATDYQAGIGWHNTGGSGNGALTLIPYAQNSNPWGGNVGLYIAQNSLKFNGTAISLASHTHAWNSLTHSSTTLNQAILTNGSVNGWKLYTLNISGWDNAANNAHSHSNKLVLDGITSTLVNNWNTAYNFVNTISGTDTDKVINKWDEIVNFLAGITEDNKLNTLLNSKLSVYELANNTNVGAIKNNGIYYSTSDASSGTLVNSPFSTGFTLINMTSYDEGDDLRRSRLAFNAYGEIKVSNDRDLANTAETWYNVLTSKNSGISGSTIKLNGTSITVYSSNTADSRYVKKVGDTMSGALNLANNTWNKIGDDSYIGDCNTVGMIGIKAANTTYPGIAFFNNENTRLGNLTVYSNNIKYRTYSLQFLDNGNTSVSAGTWMNPFSTYNASAVADGQAICVWGQSSYLSNLASDSGDISLWLKRVSAKAATLNMVLDGEYYANGNLRLAHISEIPTALKNPHALTISLNGASQGPYDGSAAKNINITPSSIGAAAASHNHNDRYYTKSESNAKYITDITTSINKLTFTRNGSNITRDITVNNVLSLGRRNPLTERNAISGIYTYGTYSNTDNLAPTGYFETLGFGEGVSGTIEIGGNWTGGQLYWRALRDCCDNWYSWKTILDSSNYSSILDSRYYTESEVNNLLSNKLNISNFNWTNLSDKIVAGNEFNIVNAGFNNPMWINYLPINDRSKTATISGYHFGNGATGYTSIIASGFIKKGSSSSYVLLGDGGHKAISDFAISGHTHDGRYLRWNGSIADISAMGWGTLTAANGYTILSHASSSDGGDMGWVYKNGQIFYQIDGFFYQNEGKYRLTDISETVTTLSTSGNYLTWTKNGATNNIIIPFSSTTHKILASLNLDSIDKANEFRDKSTKSLLVGYLANNVFTELSDGIVLSASVPGQWCHQMHLDDNRLNISHRCRVSDNTGWSHWYLLLDTSNSSISGGGSTGGSSITVTLANTSKTLTIPTSLPASDVYDWAKQSTKPTYNFSEITPGIATIGDGSNRLMFRTNESYRNGIYYSTPGNEALVFGTKYSVTSWIFATTDPNSQTAWTSLIPSLQIKNGRVTINKLIANATDASYNLDVNGSANATALYENGIRVSINGHTHNYLPLAGGTMIGSICSDSGYVILNPIKASYHTTTSTVLGCITINLPANVGNTMISMWIDVYIYEYQKSFSVHCGGYTYNNSTWVNSPFATVYGANHRVRLGHNGTQFVVYIGETNTTWSYPQVSVRNVTLGFSPTLSNWTKAWSVSFSTSVSNVTYDTTTYAWTTKNLSKDEFATAEHTHSNYVTALGTNGNYLTWTKNGNTNNITILYATSATNADKLDGYHATSGNNKPWGTIPVITTGGYMDVGKHFEFHYDNTTGSDYSTILMCTGNYGNIVNLPSASGTLALTSQIPNVTNYYWANIKISNASNSNTAPTFGSAIVNTRLSIASSTLTKTNPTNLQLVINGPSLDSSVTLGLKDWPGIGFYMPGRTWGSLIFNGNITAINSDYNGYINYYGAGFRKNGSSDSYVLLGGGGHKALSDFMFSNVKYALSDTIGGKALLAYKLYYISSLVDLASIDNFHEAYTFKYALWNGNLEGMGSSFPGTSNGIILSGGWTSATYGFQLAIDDDPNYFIALRQRGNGTWSNWKRIPMADGTGASGTWNINISGNAATATNADKVDGYHASSLVKFYLSPMTSNAPADSAKSWFIDTMPSASGAIVYNVPGAEKTIIAGKSTGPHGHMLQLNYDDNYPRLLRYRGGSWMTTDWEKISAGYADSSGNADKVDGQHFNWNNNKNDHTYLWAASDNGNAYLVHRASISVNYATYARYVYCTSGNYLNFQWSGQSDLPTWLFGSNDGTNVYIWNPSNFSVYKANKSDQLEAYTSWGFTDPGRFVRAIRYNGWHTRLYMGYYRDATLENTVHVGYADDADTLDGNHASAFALVGHTHNYDNVYSKLGHTHDDRYYTESEINSKLSAYLPLAGGTMTGLIKGNNKGGSWIHGRANAALYLPRNVQGDWHPVVGFKTKTGSWEFGSVGYDDNASFSWESDSNYNSGTNTTTVVYLRNTSGTIALTSEIPTKSSWNYDDIYSKLGHTHAYLPLAGGDMNNGARISSSGGSLYLGNSSNAGWVLVQDLCSQLGNNYWKILQDGNAFFAKNIGIGIASPSYKLHVVGDSYATGWSRAVSGFYCQDTGVHFTHNDTKGQIAITSNNEFCWGANSNILYFNYALPSLGTTVTLYVWNAGSSSSYASHTMGHITLGNGSYLLKRVGYEASWYNGRDRAIVRQTTAKNYTAIISSKTANGSWEIGNNSNNLYFTYITDTNYNNATNVCGAQLYFSSSGSIYATHFYENSDIRYKKILKNLSINYNIIANLPLFDFKWIENNTIGTGTSALAVLLILPNLVSGTNKLTLDYGVLGTIAGITACKELVMLKSELLQLKEKVKLLEDKLRKYENI